MTQTTNKESLTIEFLPVQTISMLASTRSGGPAEMSAHGNAAKVLQVINVNMGEMAEKISATLAVLRTKIDESAPDTCTVKFSLGVTGEGNLIIGTVGASAGIEVSATWNK